MNVKEFKARAKEIEGNPKKRLSKKVKEFLKKPDMFFDAHCHVFDIDSIPNPYFMLRMLSDRENIYNLLDRYVDSDSEKNIPGTDIEDFFRIAVSRSMKEITEYFYKKFYKNNNTILIPLMMDIDEGWGARSVKTVEEQITEVKELMNEFPLIPFFAVDPRKTESNKPGDNLYENFINAFTGDNPLFGIKLYPALGYLPTDPRLNEIYKVCNQKNIPITTHCGGKMIKTRVRVKSIKGKKMLAGKVVDYSYKYSDARGNKSFEAIANYLNHPARWEPVFFEYKNIKINFGHFGGIDAWKQQIKEGKSTRIETIKKFAKEYNGRVFTDFSYNFAKNRLSNYLPKYISKNPEFKKLIMYGTDLHVVLPASNFKRDFKRFREKNNVNWYRFSVENPKHFLGI